MFRKRRNSEPSDCGQWSQTVRIQAFSNTGGGGLEAGMQVSHRRRQDKVVAGPSSLVATKSWKAARTSISVSCKLRHQNIKLNLQERVWLNGQRLRPDLEAGVAIRSYAALEERRLAGAQDDCGSSLPQRAERIVHEGSLHGAGSDRLGVQVRTAPCQGEPREFREELTPPKLVIRKR